MDDPQQKPEVQVVLAGRRILTTTVANLVSRTLREVGVGDGGHAFHVTFAEEVTEAERDLIEVRPTGHADFLEHAPQLRTEWSAWRSDRFQGYLDARSSHHVAGWARDLDDATDKVELELVTRRKGRDHVLHRFKADQFSGTLAELGVGDGVHAFNIQLPSPLIDEELAETAVRIAATQTALQHAPELTSKWEPIAHMAMDIVNNCNLRCPFCVVDYSNTRVTKFMADETFAAALRLIPYVTDGNFWLSCLHEATLHPKLLAFIASVPREYRHKLYYTTNLAKRMPESYFSAICDAGLHHLNISLESLTPEIYERFRAGAKHPIFEENWNRLLHHHRLGKAPPPLRYNIMCYRSNLLELPALVDMLLREKRAWQVELRHTYDVAHIPRSFRETEFLTTDEWAWLQNALAHHDPAQVVLLMPKQGRGYDVTDQRPVADPENDDAKFSPNLFGHQHAWNQAPRPYNLSMSWDGVLRVYGWKPVGEGHPDQFVTYAKTNIHFLRDPMAFLAAL